MIGRKRRSRRQGTRHAEKKSATLRFRRWLVGALCLGLSAAGALAVAGGLVPLPDLPQGDYPIRTLKVEAAFEQVGREDIVATVAPLAAGGFFETDVGAIREALIALPWVQAASVRRVWPDALHITLVEERAMARWASGGLVNASGEVFHPAAAAGADQLPLFDGPARSAGQVLERYLGLQTELAPLGLAIASIAMDARRAWELTLDNGIRLTLGRRDPEQQLRRFTRFYPQVMAARAGEIEQVDLRYTNGFAVRWRDAAPTARADAGKTTGDAV